MESPPIDLTCPICLGLFRFPSTLSCGHSFCTECATQSLSNESSCPVCRVTVSSAHPSYTLRTLVENHLMLQGQSVSDEESSSAADDALQACFQRSPRSLSSQLASFFSEMIPSHRIGDSAWRIPIPFIIIIFGVILMNEEAAMVNYFLGISYYDWAIICLCIFFVLSIIMNTPQSLY